MNTIHQVNKETCTRKILNVSNELKATQVLTCIISGGSLLVEDETQANPVVNHLKSTLDCNKRINGGKNINANSKVTNSAQCACSTTPFSSSYFKLFGIT